MEHIAQVQLDCAAALRMRGACCSSEHGGAIYDSHSARFNATLRVGVSHATELEVERSNMQVLRDCDYVGLLRTSNRWFSNGSSLTSSPVFF